MNADSDLQSVHGAFEQGYNDAQHPFWPLACPWADGTTLQEAWQRGVDQYFAEVEA